MLALEIGRAPDGLGKKVGDIDGSILATEHAVRNTAALDVLAVIIRIVVNTSELGGRLALVKVAEERFLLVNPNCSLLVICSKSIVKTRC